MKTVNSKSPADALFDEAAVLAGECAENGVLPYMMENPLPPALNMITGLRLADANRVLLELYAARQNAGSTKWIFEADADALELKLKEETEKPISLVARIDRQGTETEEVQGAYLLDSFTEESIQNVLRMASEDRNITEGADAHRAAAAKNFLKNYSEYNAGTEGAQKRKLARNAVKENMTGAGMKEAWENATRGLDGDEKAVFLALYSYYLRQDTGLKMDSGVKPEEISKAIRRLSKESPRVLVRTMTEACLMAERAAELGFSPERLPQAARFEAKRIAREEKRKREIKVLRNRDRTLKPRSHERGRF